MSVAVKKQPTQKQLENRVNAFNNSVGEKDAVEYFSHSRALPAIYTLKSKAFILAGHTACVFLDGVRGCVSIEFIRCNGKFTGSQIQS